MNNLSGRLVVYLVGGAAIFLILFGIRASASIINPILLAAVITITVLPVPSRLTKRGVPGWLALVLSILMVVLLLGLVIATVFFSVAKLSTELPTYMESTNIIDLEGSDELREIGKELEELEILFYLARVKVTIKRILEKDGVLDIIPDERFFTSVASAVEAVSLAEKPG